MNFQGCLRAWSKPLEIPVNLDTFDIRQSEHRLNQDKVSKLIFVRSMAISMPPLLIVLFLWRDCPCFFYTWQFDKKNIFFNAIKSYKLKAKKKTEKLQE